VQGLYRRCWREWWTCRIGVIRRCGAKVVISNRPVIAVGESKELMPLPGVPDFPDDWAEGINFGKRTGTQVLAVSLEHWAIEKLAIGP